MPWMEVSLLGLAVLEGGFGLWAVCLTRMRSGLHVRWGQRFSLIALLFLGLTTMLAACWHAFALTPLGLFTGLLVVACVCEYPQTISPSPDSSGLLLREQVS